MIADFPVVESNPDWRVVPSTTDNIDHAFDIVQRRACQLLMAVRRSSALQLVKQRAAPVHGNLQCFSSPGPTLVGGVESYMLGLVLVVHVKARRRWGRRLKKAAFKFQTRGSNDNGSDFGHNHPRREWSVSGCCCQFESPIHVPTNQQPPPPNRISGPAGRGTPIASPGTPCAQRFWPFSPRSRGSRGLAARLDVWSATTGV